MFRILRLRPWHSFLDLRPRKVMSMTTSCQQKNMAVTAHDKIIETSGCAETIPAKFNLDDYKNAHKRKRLSEIVRALLIFKLCTYETLVRNSLSLVNVSKRILGTRLYTRCMKATIYNQFVAGETEAELKVAVGKLQESAIRPMLSVPMEDDFNQSMSRDDWYSQNLQTILGCVRLAKTVDPNYPMSQIKLTAVVPGDLCAAFSKRFPDPHENLNVLTRLIDGLNGGTIHIDGMDDNKIAGLNKALEKLKTIGEVAENLGVRLLVDAEYTYLNPALRSLSLAMMLQFNRQRPIVAYTYQNYLKKTFEELHKDCTLIRSRGACFATKLVRGAYMYKERQMAEKGGYEDPVHETFHNTTAMYNQSVEYLLDAMSKDPDKFYIVVASHNEGTILHAVQEIRSRNLKPDNGGVFFAQLYGMSDYLSSALGQAGFVVYKSTPYGPIDETIPYLHRRALENTSVLGGTKKERQLLWKSLVNRVTFGALPK